MLWRQRMADCSQKEAGSTPSTVRGGGASHDCGVALVITLLLLFLLSAIGLAAVLSAGSDLLINGYYGNYRGSFYAADSGINIARQAMYNQLNASFTSNFATFQTPPPAPIDALAGTISTNITTNYGGNAPCPINPPSKATSTTCYLNADAGTGANAKSWTESFQITNASLTLPQNFTNPLPVYSCIPTPGTTLGCPTAGQSAEITSYKYVYNYALTSVGSATGAEQSTINESGTIDVYVAGIPAVYNAAFSIFGAFVTNWSPCTLGWLVPGTMTGTMFTDGSWGFGTGGSYIFTDPVGQADANAGYWVDGGCTQSPNSSYTAPDGEVVVPQFQDGFSVNQAAITQPTDSYSQSWAVLDGTGCGENSTTCGGTSTPSSPTAAQMNAVLKDINQNPYPTTGAASGVYLSYVTNPGTGQLTMAGGGLYVEGNASLVLTAQTGPGPNNDPQQVIAITQGSTTTTMTVDPVTNTTVVSSGTTTLTLAGVPANCSNFGAPPNPKATPPSYCTTVPSLTSGSTPGTMVYVNGTITSMTGPGQGVGAIQDQSAVTIAALGDINITGDVIYKTEPVTTTQNQNVPGTNPPCCNGTPVATLINGSDHNQDLGIFTANGNIILSSPYSNDNLEVDGAQAVIGQSCASNSCGFLVNGCINTFNNVGGQIQTNIFGACLNTENTYYDRRYTSRPGFAPPWFPSTTITNTASSITQAPTLTVQRTSWVSSSGQ